MKRTLSESMTGKISKHTVNPHIYAETGRLSTSANKAVYS